MVQDEYILKCEFFYLWSEGLSQSVPWLQALLWFKAVLCTQFTWIDVTSALPWTAEAFCCSASSEKELGLSVSKQRNMGTMC